MQESMPEELVVKKKANVQINFPNNETREQKLARKQRARDIFYRSTPEPLVMANLSKNHPHYGMSPAEHLRAKQNDSEM